MYSRDSIRRSATTFAVAGLLCCLAAPAVAADKGFKFERDVDFDQYRKFDWIATAEKPADSPLSIGGEVDTAIRNAIDQQLQAQGYEPALAADADFLVSFDGALESVTDFDGLRRDIRPGVAWVIEGSVQSYNRGTLMITVYDAETEKLVWSGWTTEKVKNRDHPEEQVGRAVRRLLKKFPPK